MGVCFVIFVTFYYLCGMKKQDITDNDCSAPIFKEQEYLAPFIKYMPPLLEEISEDKPLLLYRTNEDIPINEFGQTPNALRARKGFERKIGRKYTQEEVDNFTEEQRRKVIGGLGLSCNDTEEAAIESFNKSIKTLKDRGASDNEIEVAAQRRGTQLYRIKIHSKLAAITKSGHGHRNIYLYEGVSLEDCRDKSYEPRKLDHQNYEEP